MVDCGCYYCLHTFSEEDIEDYVGEGVTALCPNCGIDSVVEETNKYDLRQMQKYWFGIRLRDRGEL